MYKECSRKYFINIASKHCHKNLADFVIVSGFSSKAPEFAMPI